MQKFKKSNYYNSKALLAKTYFLIKVSKIFIFSFSLCTVYNKYNSMVVQIAMWGRGSLLRLSVF
jgi:hypothetical protein